jgi:hypothetical protein
MQERNRAWIERYNLEGRGYNWTLEPPELVFARESDEVVASIAVVGTTSQVEGTFVWAWANAAVPTVATAGLEAVREFGRRHDLSLLSEPSSGGGLREGKELAAIAGRVLDAEGIFIQESGDVTSFLAIRSFHVRPRNHSVGSNTENPVDAG